jgi:dTMP kinase
VDSRGQGADRLESESRAFHERVRYAFLDLAAADPKRYLVLDAARPPEELAAAVEARIERLLTSDDHPPDASTAPPSHAPEERPLEMMEELVEPPQASNNGRRD